MKWMYVCNTRCPQNLFQRDIQMKAVYLRAELCFLINFNPVTWIPLSGFSEMFLPHQFELQVTPILRKGFGFLNEKLMWGFHRETWSRLQSRDSTVDGAETCWMLDIDICDWVVGLNPELDSDLASICTIPIDLCNGAHPRRWFLAAIQDWGTGPQTLIKMDDQWK